MMSYVWRKCTAGVSESWLGAIRIDIFVIKSLEFIVKLHALLSLSYMRPFRCAHYIMTAYGYNNAAAEANVLLHQALSAVR